MNKRITTSQLSELRKAKSVSFTNTLLESGGYPIDILEVESINYPNFNLENIAELNQLVAQDSIDYFTLAKLLYESLPLNRKQASDNLFWSYLNLTQFFPLIQKVENSRISSDLEDEEKCLKILDKYFIISTPSQNGLIKSLTAGLWWSVHLTVDESLADKYYYSRIFLSEKHLKDKNLGTYQLIRDKKTLHAILDFYEENKNSEYNGVKVGTEAFAQQMIKLLNQIGGLTLLSYLSKDEIKARMDVYKETIVKRALRVKERKVVSREKILEEKRTADPIADPSFSMDDEVAEPEIEDEPLEDRDMSTILKYISIYSDGTGYFQNDEFEDDAPFKIAITEESLSEGKALYFYDNFKVNQVDVVAFMKNRKVYNNCLHNLTKDVLLTELIVINSEQLIGVLQKINHIWHIKFIKTSLLKQNNTNLRANGFTIGCNDIDNIQEYITKLIPFELIDSLSGALIPDGLRTKGVQLNGSTFSEYIDDVLPFWPELKKMM